MASKMISVCASFGGGCEYTSHQSFGCRHYRRRCRIVAPCCGESFWCRHCHNDATSDGKNSHEMERTDVKEVICQRCQNRQSASAQCTACGEVFGSYFCELCNFWDDDGAAKKVFHCDKCKICRIGGRENFFHCDTCGSCYPNEIRNEHTCVENAMHQACPVCLQDLFQSTTQVTILRCGHTIHQECLRGLQQSFAGLQSIRCPLCSVSLYKYEDLWAELDRQVEETPMPKEYANTHIRITCNDCQETSAVKFHILGHKCQRCSSYNTRRE
mmetsp:Transcript_70674/g.153471  ORF Transcript_70674/g.153471 Transcript_70674/m.153471 type:complete len:271 (-) Transcript_70674:148-960(-)